MTAVPDLMVEMIRTQLGVHLGTRQSLSSHGTSERHEGWRNQVDPFLAHATLDERGLGRRWEPVEGLSWDRHVLGDCASEGLAQG